MEKVELVEVEHKSSGRGNPRARNQPGLSAKAVVRRSLRYLLECTFDSTITQDRMPSKTATHTFDSIPVNLPTLIGGAQG